MRIPHSHTNEAVLYGSVNSHMKPADPTRNEAELYRGEDSSQTTKNPCVFRTTEV